MRRNARTLIEERYTWNAIYDALDEAIEICVPDFFEQVTAMPIGAEKSVKTKLSSTEVTLA